MLTVTVDNASANDIACDLMKGIAMDNDCIGSGQFLHVRCIEHIINLVVQDGLKEGGDHFTKVRAIVRWCRGSAARKNQFRELAERHDIVYKGTLANDVPTRWNSTYVMLNKYVEV